LEQNKLLKIRRKQSLIADYQRRLLNNDTLFTSPWQLQKLYVSPIAPYFKKTVPNADFAQAVPNHYE